MQPIKNISKTTSPLLLAKALAGLMALSSAVSAQQQEDSQRKAERLAREAAERVRQTQRILEVDKNNPRATKALEARLGEGLRGGPRHVVQRERQPGETRQANKSTSSPGPLAESRFNASSRNLVERAERTAVPRFAGDTKSGEQKPRTVDLSKASFSNGESFRREHLNRLAETQRLERNKIERTERRAAESQRPRAAARK